MFKSKHSFIRDLFASKQMFRLFIAGLVLLLTQSVRAQFSEQEGLLCFEAEHFTGAALNNDLHKSTWYIFPADTAIKTPFVAALPDIGNALSWAGGSEISYKVAFSTTGTYNVWVRAMQPSNAANSCFLGFNGAQLGDSVFNFPGTGWRWRKHPIALTIATADTGTFLIRNRENGFKIDKVVITSNLNYDPSTINSGEGPSESLYKNQVSRSMVVNVSGLGSVLLSDGSTVTSGVPVTKSVVEGFSYGAIGTAVGQGTFVKWVVNAGSAVIGDELSDTTNVLIQSQDVNITAPASGFKFLRWDIVSGTATIESDTSLTTKVTLSSGNVVIKAVFDIPTNINPNLNINTNSKVVRQKIFSLSGRSVPASGNTTGSGRITARGTYIVKEGTKVKKNSVVDNK